MHYNTGVMSILAFHRTRFFPELLQMFCATASTLVRNVCTQHASGDFTVPAHVDHSKATLMSERYVRNSDIFRSWTYNLHVMC